jgi:hypothetical protein
LTCSWCGQSGSSGSCVDYSSACLAPKSVQVCASPAPANPALLSGHNAIAASQQAGGIAGAVLVTLFAAAYMAIRVHRAEPSKGAPRSASAEQWRTRAGRGWPVVLAAWLFQTFGLAAGAAALSIPWWSGGFSASVVLFPGISSGPCAGASSYFLTVTALMLNVRCCASQAASIESCGQLGVPNLVFMLGPAAVYLTGLVFLAFPAWLLAHHATFNLLFLARHRVMPSTTGCVVAGLPVVQGLSWGSYILQSIGAAFLFTYSVLIFALVGIVTAATGSTAAASAATAAFGAGTGLLGAAMCASFVGNILYSVAGCCGIGNIPGVGMSRRSCCCTELDIHATASGAVAAPPPTTTVNPAALAALGGAYAGSAQPYAAPLPYSAPYSAAALPPGVQPLAHNPFAPPPTSFASAPPNMQPAAWPPAKSAPPTW